MRYRLMAMYDGSPFEAGIGPTDDDIVLFAACPPPEDLGFEPATGHWRKQVRFSDVQAVWESRPVGVFHGERCLVLDDLGDRLHVGYLGHDGLTAERLGYWQVDRGVFELIAPRAEVTDILEERVELRRAAARPTDATEDTTYQAKAPAGPAPVWGPEHPSGPILGPAPASQAAAYVPVLDGRTGVTLPTAAEAPLPLEAEALRAASASRQLAGQDAHARPASGLATVGEAEPVPAAASRQHRTARRRQETERLFADLATIAGLPASSYAVGGEVEGALCLVETEQGFEVFLAADGARHELQVFATEEAACFYLFGVLAAEAVQTGALAPVAGWQPRPA